MGSTLDSDIEYIGKVKMDYSLLDESDNYSDGDIENELLEIVKEHNPSEYAEIIRQKGSWPVLYHLSEYRTNILGGIPFKGDDDVLEIGAGCGAITGYLCDHARNVTSIELSRRRSLINAYRHREVDNLEIIVANFNNAYKQLNKKYDYVMLIGVLEYARLYIGDEDPYVGFLEKIRKFLKPGGKIVVAIENRFGLKYFAGCKEDHLGQVFVGINGYSGHTETVQTFTKKELEDIISGAGYDDYKFYYPYPDYKFATRIYSDEYLPRKGELNNNIRNYDNSRLKLFDEDIVFDELIDNNIFQYFSNSFLVVIKG